MVDTFASGLANGIGSGINLGLVLKDRAQKDKDQARIDADLKIDDDVHAATAEFMKNRLLVPEAVNSDSTIQAKTVASGPATGINVATQPVAAPKYRAATVDDMADVANFRVAEYLKAGRTDKATEAHKDYMTFAAEKIHSEEKARESLAISAITGIDRGDYSGVATFYKAIPNGNSISGITENKDGTLTVKSTDADGKARPDAIVKSRADLSNTIAMLGKSDFALKYLDTQFKMSMEGRKATEDERHHREGEKNDREKNAAGGDGATSEMKNAKAFFPDMKPAEGLKKFRELMTEKSRGMSSHSDGMGGENVINHDTGEIYNLSRSGKKTVMQAAGATPVAASGIATPQSAAAPSGRPPLSQYQRN